MSRIMQSWSIKVNDRSDTEAKLYGYTLDAETVGKDAIPMQPLALITLLSTYIDWHSDREFDLQIACTPLNFARYLILSYCSVGQQDSGHQIMHEKLLRLTHPEAFAEKTETWPPAIGQHKVKCKYNENCRDYHLYLLQQIKAPGHYAQGCRFSHALPAKFNKQEVCQGCFQEHKEEAQACLVNGRSLKVRAEQVKMFIAGMKHGRDKQEKTESVRCGACATTNKNCKCAEVMQRHWSKLLQAACTLLPKETKKLSKAGSSPSGKTKSLGICYKQSKTFIT